MHGDMASALGNLLHTGGAACQPDPPQTSMTSEPSNSLAEDASTNHEMGSIGSRIILFQEVVQSRTRWARSVVESDLVLASVPLGKKEKLTAQIPSGGLCRSSAATQAYVKEQILGSSPLLPLLYVG